MNSKEWPYLVTAVLAATIIGVSVPVYAILWGRILTDLLPTFTDEARAHTQAMGNFYSLLFFVIGIITSLVTTIQKITLIIAGENLTIRLRTLAFGAILNQEIGWFDDDDNAVGALCTRLSADASSVEGATGSRISVVVQSLSTLICSIALCLHYEWRLGLVAVGMIPFTLIPAYIEVR